MQIEEVVGKVASRWRGAPKVSVVRSAGDLPFPAPSDAEGAYRAGEVHLVADALTLARAVQVLGHEAIGHHGIRGALGSGWRGFMADLSIRSRSDPAMRGARAHIERTYVDDSGVCTLRGVQLADELSAALVEQVMDTATGRIVVQDPLRKQALALRGHVVREVLLLDSPVCRDQIEGVILLAEGYLRRGGKLFGVWWRVTSWYAPHMAKPDPRPLHPTRPPMSWQESRDLLEAAEAPQRAMKELKGAGLALMLIIGFCLLGGGILSVLWGLTSLFQ